MVFFFVVNGIVQVELGGGVCFCFGGGVQECVVCFGGQGLVIWVCQVGGVEWDGVGLMVWCVGEGSV